MAGAWKSPAGSGEVAGMTGSTDDDDARGADRPSMADVLTNLPAVRAAKKVNTLENHGHLVAQSYN
jgi:hypothetical protein